ncbi:MAG: cyclic pyranopterin monophosphate synthase MoaC [Candidatus Riflebacteria bacterium]|nr:cyclic pyranopterin monophosphate synthase MoaC [Candidatus Riflebacteria bacterium]
MEFSHFDEAGHARMVDVTGKLPTQRMARATVDVFMARETLTAILEHRIAKGDVFEVARIAGIMAAKRVHELIPLCHQIPLGSVGLDFQAVGEARVRITAVARAHAVTGVEMEALTACAVAALTVYDMCKAIDRAMVVSQLALAEKRGGKSDYLAAPGEGDA